MSRWVALAAGGVAGTFARYAVSTLLFRWFGPAFPLGTLAVNFTGCFLIGIVAALPSLGVPVRHETQLLLVTGFCGAFTTFSAFILETSGLLDQRQAAKAFANVALSLMLGFAGFRLGVVLAETTGRLMAK